MSVTDWLRTGNKMPNDEPATRPALAAARLTDAQFLADVAIDALRDGRYELARAVTALAAQAARSDLARNASETTVTDNPPTLQLTVPSPPTARCWHSPAGGYPCEQRAYLDRLADVWRHIDPDTDHDHSPVVGKDGS
jgi:hypothetical protein